MGRPERVGCRRGLVVAPPYVFAPDLGIAAVDVGFATRSIDLVDHVPMVCLGGHPALECALDVTGAGQSHDPGVAVDRSLPAHRRFVERLREVLDPSAALQVVPLPGKRRSQVVPFRDSR